MKEKVKGKGKMGKTKTGKKKNQGQRGVNSRLDLDIFKYMSSGCATFAELLAFFK